jgi:hypothetical protein
MLHLGILLQELVGLRRQEVLEVGIRFSIRFSWVGAYHVGGGGLARQLTD